jgi:urease subunit beta
MIPGEVRVSTEPLEFGTDAEKITMVVVNDGDRPIQIGSHLHLPAANPALTFDREAAEGFRLDIPSGTSVRFEPGVSRTVTLIALGGLKRVPGLQIVPDEDNPHALLSAHDDAGTLLGEARVRADFKLSAASAEAWIDGGFQKPR